MIFYSDLDNTIIFSYKKIEGDAVCVEEKDGKKLSYMSTQSYELLQKINNKILFVPVTTRSLEQYERLSIIKNGFPQYALVCNGGILLKENKIYKPWFDETLNLIKPFLSEIKKGLQLLKEDKNIIFDIRFVDDVFVFTKSSNIEFSIKRLENNLDKNKVFVASNGSKLYIFPKILTKGEAVKRFLKLFNFQKTISAGDSIFDVSMLLKTDKSIIPDDNFMKDILYGNKNIVVSSEKGCYFGNFVTKYVADRI